jgi:endonuclease/exonuclease/phosphatase family metal-dependent hydrolase
VAGGCRLGTAGLSGFSKAGVLLGPAGAEALHVMSFNLRYASEGAPNPWPLRRPVVAELLRAEQPTVIGTQEGLSGQLRDIEDDLPEYYDWVGVGRAGGSRDEFMAVFYDTRRLAPVDIDHFWLSDAPDVVGSSSWGNVCIRMVTRVRFADAGAGREFVVLNTHFDNLSEYSRVRSAELVRDRIGAIAPDLPVVLTGDFNAPAGDSATYHILVDGTGLTDTWTAAARRHTAQYATCHGYLPLVPDGPRIDWILTRGVGSVLAAGINTFARDGRFPSDHLPVQALIGLG